MRGHRSQTTPRNPQSNASIAAVFARMDTHLPEDHATAAQMHTFSLCNEGKTKKIWTRRDISTAIAESKCDVSDVFIIRDEIAEFVENDDWVTTSQLLALLGA